MQGTPKRGSYARKFLYAFTISLACLITFQAKGLRQPGESVTLKADNIALFEVFKTIYKQTKLKVSYSNAMVNDKEKVDVNFFNTPIQDVMAVLLKGKDLKFTFTENLIIIGEKEKGSSNGTYPDTVVNAIPSVSGKVTDAAGIPLPGVTVQVKGTNQGTTTDMDGKFTVTKVAIGEMLVISSVGFEKREVAVKGRSILVQMNVQVSGLDETVVIAYGTTTRRLSTGNISTVKGEDIAKQPVSNPLLALQGRVPGVFISQATGLPGSGVTVRIQGENSISKGNDPLYIVDGVPYSSQLLPTLESILGSSGGPIIDGISSGSGNPLNFINPMDIESIDVLKDADATAIYGSRAANGAILITTKKGKIGQTKVNINVRNGWGKIPKKLDLLITQEYLQMRHEAKKNDNATIDLADYDINGTWDTSRYTDWQKVLMGGTASFLDMQTSVSAGNANIQYLLGGAYHRETTVFPGNFSDQKGSLHFHVTNVSTNQKFHLNFSGNYLISKNNLLSEDLTNTAITLSPVAPPLHDANGNINWAPDNNGVSTWNNPLSILSKTYNIKTKSLIANMLLSYKLLPSLDIHCSLGYTDLQSNETSIIPLTAWQPEYRAWMLRTAAYADNDIHSWIIEPHVSYSRPIAKGKLEAIVGKTILQTTNNGLKLSGSGYNNDLVMADIKSAATIVPISNISSLYKYSAIFSRLNYNWENKYIVNLTGRRDGSSRFGKANQFHNFWGIGVGWIFSEESFFTKKIPLISFGKFRTSYGTSGNDQIGDYQFLNLYNPIGVGVPYQSTTSLAPNGLSNPYLEWEETKKLQFGIDIGILKDKILFSTNYFINRSSNQLINYSLPYTTGFSSVTKNWTAKVQNSGWEFSINANLITTPIFNWKSDINLTISQNKLISFPGLELSSYANSLVLNHPITLTKAYRFSGVGPTTGVYQFIDNHGNHTSTPNFLEDRTALINTSPTAYGGIINSISYKSISLDFLFQFVKQKGPNYLFGNVLGAIFNLNQPSSVLKRWQKPGDITSIQRYNSNFGLFISTNNALLSDAAYTDASYIRLKNLSISWQIPNSWKKRSHIKNLKVYFQGQNLLTIADYKGFDPETLRSTTLPPLKVFTLGLQAEL